MLVQCWATVRDAGPSLKYYWIYVFYLLPSGNQRVKRTVELSKLHPYTGRPNNKDPLWLPFFQWIDLQPMLRHRAWVIVGPPSVTLAHIQRGVKLRHVNPILVLAQRRRRWANKSPTLGQRLVFDRLQDRWRELERDNKTVIWFNGGPDPLHTRPCLEIESISTVYMAEH